MQFSGKSNQIQIQDRIDRTQSKQAISTPLH